MKSADTDFIPPAAQRIKRFFRSPKLVRTVPLLFTLALYLSGSPLTAAELTESPVPRAAVECGIGQFVPDVVFPRPAGAGEIKLSALCAGAPLTVIAMTSSSCPLSMKLAPTLARIEQEWKDRAAFLYLNSVRTDSAADTAEFAKRSGWSAPCISDPEASLAAALGLRSTTEVLIVDKARTVLYRGAVDDQYGIGYQKDQAGQRYLQDALTALQAGRNPLVQATSAPGCVIDWPRERKATPVPLTWHSRISRIVQAHCQECHHAGGLGPFPLETMEQVTSRAGMLKKVLDKGIMPPWFAAPPPAGSHSPWSNDRTMPEADKQDLLAWLAGDRAAGDAKDAPLPRSWSDGWSMGKPDAIVTLADPVPVETSGRMPYIIRKVKTDFPEDRWVEAMEVRPEARAQTHHVLTFILPPDQGRPSDGDDFLAAYVPGSSATVYPAGYAKRLPKGATILFQLHYTPDGTATTDRTSLGLKFAASPPRHIVRVAGVKNNRLLIPPGAANHQEKASLPVPVDAQILAFMPHMHLRGKAFRYDLVLPDNSRSTVLHVPAYDFNWQIQYRLAEPLNAPRGSRVEAFAWFDNSAGNPANPDPSKAVKWGLQSEEEMLIGYLDYVLPEGAGEAETLTTSRLGKVARRLDRNGDSRVSKEEAGERLRSVFDKLDTNRDGFVNAQELRAGGIDTTE